MGDVEGRYKWGELAHKQYEISKSYEPTDEEEDLEEGEAEFMFNWYLQNMEARDLAKSSSKWTIAMVVRGADAVLQVAEGGELQLLWAACSPEEASIAKVTKGTFDLHATEIFLTLACVSVRLA